MFGSEIRKISIPLHTPVWLYIVGYKWVFISRTCFRDAPVKTSCATYLIIVLIPCVSIPVYVLPIHVNLLPF